MLLFRPANIPFVSLFPSFWLGFRFDAKWISIILLPIVLFSIELEEATGDEKTCTFQMTPEEFQKFSDALRDTEKKHARN